MGRHATGIIIALGSIALLGAMATDFVGVIGRAVGWRPLGLIEIVQFCVVGATSAALVVATLQGAHAAVHVLTERLPKAAARVLLRISDLFGALLFVAWAFGCGWLLMDTLHLDERTDVLDLPIAPARLLWITALLVVAVIFFVHMVRGDAEPPGDVQAAEDAGHDA